MAVKTKDEYLKSLQGRDLKIYMFGELIKDPANHPIQVPYDHNFSSYRRQD
jgi:4-hydroxybutyryl-CoA dehydratase/vinylacetyl-CoA-Delta-isomerase